LACCYTIRRVRHCFLLSYGIFLVCVVVLAQNSGKSKLSYKLLSVHVRGLKHFKEDEVVAASGLKLGQYAGETEFQAAAQKLGETGLFANLSYKYQYSNAGCNLDLEVRENDKLVPVLFDNFVWFSNSELLSLLKSRMPLFDGRVPAGGNLTDRIAENLKDILAQRKIFGEADYLPAAELNGPVTSYIYKVALHPIVINEIDFAGASETELPALRDAAKPLSKQEYSRSKMSLQEQHNFLPVYLSRGYLKAKFADSEAKVTDDGPQTVVNVTVPVTPGIAYKVVRSRWSGNSALSSEQLQPLIHLKPGEPVNAVQLAEDIEEVEKLYGTRGYIVAHVEAQPEMDDTSSSVSYELKVSEGDLYRMGDLTIDGIPPQNAEKMTEQWQLKKGEPYDNSYRQRFFKVMYHDVGLKIPYDVVSKEAVDEDEKTVSVALHFVPK
jgi:outer membrane protein assembly factor BamA